MPVFCPHCGVLQPEGVATCGNCGEPLPAAQPTGDDKITAREMRAYVGVAFRYTIVPLMIAVAVLCAAWLVCSNLIQ